MSGLEHTKTVFFKQNKEALWRVLLNRDAWKVTAESLAVSRESRVGGGWGMGKGMSMIRFLKYGQMQGCFLFCWIQAAAVSSSAKPVLLQTSELRTNREKVTTLFDTEGQSARKESSLVAD